MPTRIPWRKPALRKYSVLLIFSVLGLMACSPAQALTILTQPQGQTNNEGQPFQFTVAVQGVEPFSYQWVKDGQPIPTATNKAYAFAATVLSDAGVYSVIVSDAETNITSMKTGLWVQPPPQFSVPFTNVWKYG